MVKFDSYFVMETADEMLQVLEVFETVEDTKEVIVTTVQDDCYMKSPPVASCGPVTKPSEVRLTGPAC